MYKTSYVGDNVTTEFLFSFPLFQEADVKVSIDGAMISQDQYDVCVNEEFDGGYIILSTAPAEGSKVDVFRQISLNRVVDYQPTAKIDPEDLNTDFNFLLEAFRDLRAIDIDLAEWKNVHDNLLGFIKYTMNVIEDRLSGGNVLGLYKNLLSVLDNALPQLINDYGSVAETAPNENADDYGIL